jgi:4-aminobutyrate aminotransferase-like enzyme
MRKASVVSIASPLVRRWARATAIRNPGRHGGTGRQADIDLPGLPQRPTGPFYELIVELTRSHKVLPMNSGAEAVESAIKSVRKWRYEVKGVPDGQAEIFVCADNFHGLTLGIAAFSTDASAREHFGPVAGLQIIPFSNAKALEEGITLSFGNDWQTIEMARGRS